MLAPLAPLALLLFQSPAADAELAGPPASEWLPLNQVEIIVNERIMTLAELRAYIGPRDSREEFLRSLQEERLKRVQTLLEDQAGRAMGFDTDQVRRSVDRVEKRKIDSLGGIGGAADEMRANNVDAARMRGQIEESLYASLWREWRQGLSPGPTGRMSRDRFVRPGQLHMRYQSDPRQYRVPPRVILQQLILAYPKEADASAREAVERRIVELHERVLAGEDMGEIAEIYGNTKPGSRGLTPPLDEDLVRQAYPELESFLDEAQPGDVSEAMPYNHAEHGQLGLMLVRLVERKPPLDFDAFEVQARLRREYQGALDEWRLERGRLELFQDAYVWPPPQGPGPAKARPGSEAIEADG